MKKVTWWVTILGIICIICMVFSSLMVPLVGLVIGLFVAAPLFVTLIMSHLLVGTATQTILIGSTAGYTTQFIYQRYFSSIPQLFPSWSYSIPVMIVLWFAAGWLSLTLDEIERRHGRNRPAPGP